MDLRYEPTTNSTGRIHPWQTCFGYLWPCFLLLDDAANELFLPAGLGTDRILMLATALTGVVGESPATEASTQIFWLHEADDQSTV